MTTWYYYSTQGSYYIWAATRTTCTVHTDYVPREGPCLTITRIYADRIEVGMVVSAYLPPCLLANGGYSCLHIDRLHFSKFYFVNKPLVKIPRKSSLLRPARYHHQGGPTVVRVTKPATEAFNGYSLVTVPYKYYV